MPHMGELRELTDPGAAFEAPDVATGPCDALLAMRVLVDIAAGGEKSCGRGCAEARPLPKPLAVPTRRQSPKHLRAPQVRFGQSVRASWHQGCARKRGEMVRVCETATLWSQGRDGRRQGWEQRLQLRTREVHGGAQWVAQWAAPVLQGHGPPPQAVGGRACQSTGTGQQARALAPEVEAPGGIFCIGFPGAVLPRCAIGPPGVAGPQADRRATAGEPFVTGLPRAPGRCPGAQEMRTPMVVQVGLAGRFKAPEALSGVGNFELTTAPGGRRPQARTGCGVAHSDANEEQGRLVYIRCTLMGVSSILWPSHGTRLLRG
jgi:hypothetical protein